MMSRHDVLEPQEERDSVWFNPLLVPQKVDVLVGTDRRHTRYVVMPQSEKTIPSRYDTAIRRVVCEDPDCRARRPLWCLNPGEHGGVAIGGLAPQLVKRGEERVRLDPALDPTASAKRSLEAEQAAALIARRANEEAIMIAEARKIALDDAKALELATLDATSQPKPSTPSPQNPGHGHDPKNQPANQPHPPNTPLSPPPQQPDKQRGR